MTIYSIDHYTEDENLIRIRRNLIIGLSFLSVILLIFMGYFLWEGDLTTTLILVFAFASVLGSVFVFRDQFSKSQESYKSTEIELGEDYIALRQKHKPEIRITQSEITGLIISKKGFQVQTANKFHSIHIPNTLIGYEEVKSKLSSWAEIQTFSVKDNLKIIVPMIVPSLGIIIFAILAIITRSIWPVIFIILFAFGRTIYMTWFNWRRVDITPKEKRNKLLYDGFYAILFVFFLIYILFKIF